jgi:hypothetical protein
MCVEQHENRDLISKANFVENPNPGSVSRRAKRELFDCSPRVGVVGGSFCKGVIALVVASVACCSRTTHTHLTCWIAFICGTRAASHCSQLQPCRWQTVQGGVRKPPRREFRVSFRNSRGPLTSPWEHPGHGGGSLAQVSRKFVASSRADTAEVWRKFRASSRAR